MVNRTRGEARAVRIREAATALFLEKGYERVSLDEIVKLAGGSKSSIYADFGGKSGLFVSIVETLCQGVNNSLSQLDLNGLDLRQSLEVLGFHILKLISVKEAYQLHRLAVGESGRLPQVGKTWYEYGPAKTISHIKAVLDRHKKQLPHEERYRANMAIALHDALIGNTLATLVSGLGKPASERELKRRAAFIVSLFIG